MYSTSLTYYNREKEIHLGAGGKKLGRKERKKEIKDENKESKTKKFIHSSIASFMSNIVMYILVRYCNSVCQFLFSWNQRRDDIGEEEEEE